MKNPETAKKVSLAKSKQRLSDSHPFKQKGKTPWNKGLRGAQVAWNKGKTGTVPWNKGKQTPEDVRMKQSLAKKGKPSPKKGKKYPKESK
jgi:hypothetical protein